MLKRCPKCSTEKDVNKFYRNKCKKDGLSSICKDCCRKYVIENKERYKIYNSKYWLENKEKINKQCKKYYRENREILIKKTRKYYQENMEQCKKYSKKYCQENKEKIAKRNENWRTNNKDKIDEYLKKNEGKIKKYQKVYGKKHYLENLDKYKKWNRDWRINNKDKKNEAEYRRRNNNPEVSLSHLISGYMLRSLGSNKNGMHWEDIVGYTLKDLMQYLESQFVNGMTWRNRGLYGWHVHHKIPVSLWKFESYTDREFKQCWALCNLQPLWAKDNLSIHNKVLPQPQRSVV